MEQNVIITHEDEKLNLLRVAAMAAVGVYLYKTFKKEGSITNATMGKVSNFDVNTDRLVDSIMPWINISGDKKTLVEAGAKEFLNNLKQQLLKKET